MHLSSINSQQLPGESPISQMRTASALRPRDTAGGPPAARLPLPAPGLFACSSPWPLALRVHAPLGLKCGEQGIQCPLSQELPSARN